MNSLLIFSQSRAVGVRPFRQATHFPGDLLYRESQLLGDHDKGQSADVRAHIAAVPAGSSDAV